MQGMDALQKATSTLKIWNNSRKMKDKNNKIKEINQNLHSVFKTGKKLWVLFVCFSEVSPHTHTLRVRLF